MKKETIINLFIYLLSGQARTGQAAIFYFSQIKPGGWETEVMSKLISAGQISKIEHFQIIQGIGPLSKKDIQKIIEINLQNNNFYDAIKAAKHLEIGGEKKLTFDSILNEALDFYTNKQNDGQALHQIENIISFYNNHYPIPGWLK